MEKNFLWMRLGVNIIGTKEEIKKICNGDKETLERLLKAKSFEIVGESYIPDEDGDVDFYINLIQM